MAGSIRGSDVGEVGEDRGVCADVVGGQTLLARGPCRVGSERIAEDREQREVHDVVAQLAAAIPAGETQVADYLSATVVTVVASAGLIWLAVRLASHREL